MNNTEVNIGQNPLLTREDMQRAVDQLFMPLKSRYSRGSALLTIGYTGAKCSERTAQFEAFVRPLWGLIPLTMGGGDSDLWPIYLQGVRNGTNPAHEEYWGETQESDQIFVEMAAIGLGLALTPEKLWDPLTDEEKQRFVVWLDQINHYDMPSNNWRFFIVLVNMGLKRVGASYNQVAMTEALEFLDTFYLTDGWYADGKTEQRDYYIAFAMHYYGLIYAALMEDEDPVRSNTYKERAKQFAHDFIYWFAEDGSALPYGRSLTYRFAQSAFWGAMAFAGVEVFSWGVMKGLVLRNFRWWFKQNIFHTDGVLSIGYKYPNLIMAEEYNAPGSPYWACKAFLPLSLREDHPFWMAKEEELPALNSMSIQEHPHMVICREKNHVIAWTAGQHATWEPAHGAAKYAKFAYSNLFGFSVPKDHFGLSQGAFDSMLVFSEGDGYYRGRQRCEDYRLEGHVIYSRWRVWSDVEVETWILPGVPWHVRIHRIHTDRVLVTAEGGFSFNKEELLTSPSIESNGLVLGSASCSSGIVNLLGERKAEIIKAYPNTNIIHTRTLIPTLTGNITKGVHWFVSAVLGSSIVVNPTKAWECVPILEAEAGMITVKYGESLRQSWSMQDQYMK